MRPRVFFYCNYLYFSVPLPPQTAAVATCRSPPLGCGAAVTRRPSPHCPAGAPCDISPLFAAAARSFLLSLNLSTLLYSFRSRSNWPCFSSGVHRKIRASGVASDSSHLSAIGMEENFGVFTYIVAILVTAILLRLSYVLYWLGKPLPASTFENVRTLIVLGSGGHTAEMLGILNMLQKDRFAPRVYVAAATDNMSLQKAQVFEESLMQKAKNDEAKKHEPPQFLKIYRSREVGQSYITSVMTTLIAILHALWITLKIRPQVIICNGPGTCIPLCFSAFLFKVVGIRWSSIFYVESIARVQKLSLSGLLLYKLRIADEFFVQWPQLKKYYPRAHYVGCLM